METPRRTRPRSRRPLAYVAASLIAVVGAGGVVVATNLASASATTTLASAKNVPVKSRSDTVVVNAHGLTVYTLSGERVHRLKCTKRSGCLRFWPPVTVKSMRTKLTAASGIKGKLGRLHRDGVVQVTLAGRPLYTFLGDGAKKRSAVGEGIVSFGGTWHVVALATAPGVSHTSTSTHTSSSTRTTTSTPSTQTGPYSY